MHVSSQDMALAYDSPLFRESLSARLLRKSLHFFPIPPFVPGRGGRGKIPFHDHNSLLVLPFLLFAPRRRSICSGYTLSSDASHTLKNYVSPRDQRLPAIMSSLASGLVTAELRLNTSLSIGRRWGSTSTSLQTLLRRDVGRFWMPSCLCETKPFFLHHRSCSSRATELSHALAPSSLACSVDLRKSSCYTLLLLTLRQRIAVRLQVSGLVYPDPLVNSSSCNSSGSGSI